jgi:hypothetical protein
MDSLPLIPIDPRGLNVFQNPRDALRDVFVYLDYVSERSIKRTARTNELPREDYQRLAKLLGGLSFEPGPDELDAHLWIDFIDMLALKLKLVQYDTQGKYRGYSSESPSFFNNFIHVNETQVRSFLELSPRDQEKALFETLVFGLYLTAFGSQALNEFFTTSVVGRLDPFDMWGMSTGVMPSLQFPAVRRFLVDLLAQYRPGEWYSTASLVAYLKSHHPNFLIPEKIPPDCWGNKIGRYDNFFEGPGHLVSRDQHIRADAADAFERVEGRYVERFLESLPLLLRLVDVAYAEKPDQGERPMRDALKAFRVSERLQNLMSAEERPPQVTVQPNLDVVIQSEFYPAKIVRAVSGLGDPVASPSTADAYVGVYQLKKTCVAAERARHPELDVVFLLRQISGRDLPPNVQVELDEWTGHAEQFILYDGFAVLESAEDPPISDGLIGERIAPTMRLVKDPDQVFTILEQEGCVPLRVQHDGATFTPLPEQATSAFPKLSALAEAARAPIPVKVARSIAISVRFSAQEPYDSFLRTLAELRCPFQPDNKNLIFTYDQEYQPKFDEAVQRLADSYDLQFE